MQAKFATMNEYFQALRYSSTINEFKQPSGFPVLTGDFFPYADRDDHYWSGYYTTRPQMKRLGRVLVARLRAAELLYSYAMLAGHMHPGERGDKSLGDGGGEREGKDSKHEKDSKLEGQKDGKHEEGKHEALATGLGAEFPREKLFPWLTNARRMSALFLHHDTITGTSKDFVVSDMGAKYNIQNFILKYI